MAKLFSKSAPSITVAIIIVAVVAPAYSKCQSMGKEEITTVFSTEMNSKRLYLNSLSVNDSNWAGYITASDLKNPQPTVTSVRASWLVPNVVPSIQSNEFSSIWIGIGGFFDSTLIQVGTEQDSIAGQVEYSAWYELLLKPSVTIGSVSPGDQINAAIQLENPVLNTWSISIQDITANETFQSFFNYTASRLSAEWIVERPLVGRSIATLANIGTVKFTNCSSTIGTNNGPISTFQHTQSVMYDTVQNTNGATQLAAVSDLLSDGSSFTVETSPNAIPELHSVWAIIPIVSAFSLLATGMNKQRRKADISQKTANAERIPNQSE